MKVPVFFHPENLYSVGIASPVTEHCSPGNVFFCLNQVPESSVSGYVEASKLFIGRGAIQLSWNFNYVDAGAALGGTFF